MKHIFDGGAANVLFGIVWIIIGISSVFLEKDVQGFLWILVGLAFVEIGSLQKKIK